MSVCELPTSQDHIHNAMGYDMGTEGEAPHHHRPAPQPALFMDIKVISEGFSATEVQFTAVSDAGKAAMAKIGGFACIGMTVRKSCVGYMLEALEHQGVHVSWT